MMGCGGVRAEKRRSKAEEERYLRSFVACVDKYTEMSGLRDLVVGAFGP